MTNKTRRKLITFSRALAAAKAVVKRKMTFVYPWGDAVRYCEYTRASNPDLHCLVGEILLRLGVPIPSARSKYNGVGIEKLARAKRFPITAKALEFLSRLQANQDASVPWGDCLNVAIDECQHECCDDLVDCSDTL